MIIVPDTEAAPQFQLSRMASAYAEHSTLEIERAVDAVVPPARPQPPTSGERLDPGPSGFS